MIAELTPVLLEEVASLRARITEIEAHLSRLARSCGAEVPEAVLTCRIAQEVFALPIDTIEGAILACLLTRYPEAPPWIPGLLNLHGRLVPVIDVHARLERKARALRVTDFIVVCTRDTGTVGLIVEEILGIHAVADGATRPVPPEVPSAPYVRATIDLGGTQSYLLDVARLAATSSVPEQPGGTP